jgi:Winged helix-turn helix
MRPVSVFANGPGSEIEQLEAGLHGRWREAARAVMVLLSLHGLPPAQIAVLLDCHPATVRRWISRFNDEGMAVLPDRPRSGRPRLGGRRLTRRIAALLSVPGRGPCRGSGGTWAGRRSVRGRCTGGSGWWRSGGGRS